MENNIFTRFESMIGPQALETLKTKRVAVFGCGGVGGYAIEALARSGIGQLDIIDHDVVAASNLNRQIIALHSTIGQYKVDIAKQRILDINPTCIVGTYKAFYLPENRNTFDFTKYDYIIDAIDTVSAKIDIICYAKETNTPIISCMGCGNRLDPTQLEVTDIYKTKNDPLAKVMRRELKKRHIKKCTVVCSKELPMKSTLIDETTHKKIVPSSSAFVPSVAGMIAASVVVQQLI